MGNYHSSIRNLYYYVLHGSNTVADSSIECFDHIFTFGIVVIVIEQTGRYCTGFVTRYCNSNGYKQIIYFDPPLD